MRPRAVLAVAVIAALAIFIWRAQLFTVSRPGERPRALTLVSWRMRADFNVALAAVPVGMQRLHPGGDVMVIHYWAMWERHGAAQAAALDSLRQLESDSGLRVALVCFDPYPSVARFVGRQRLRLSVLLDGSRQLSRALPCPSVPFTYVIDRSSRIAVAQAGEVDWLAPGTRATLEKLFSEPATVSTTPAL